MGIDEAAADKIGDATILAKLRTALEAQGIDLAVDETVSGDATYTTAYGEQSLFTGDTVKLANNYAHGGLGGKVYRYIEPDYLSSDKDIVDDPDTTYKNEYFDVTVTNGTIVGNLNDGKSYKFIGTTAQGAAINDLTNIDFATDEKWQLYIRDLGTEDYSNASKWELVSSLGEAKYATGDNPAELLRGDTVRLAVDYANGGQGGCSFLYLGYYDYLSSDKNDGDFVLDIRPDDPDDTSVHATIVKDMDDGTFYRFIGTLEQGNDITDSSAVDFTNTQSMGILYRYGD